MASNLDKKNQTVLSLRDKFINCFKGRSIIKTAVVAVCVGTVLQQITVCLKKLIDAPITTYTHFDFNQTIAYPSITFCREPPYKYDKMLKYGLFAHPQYTSVWRNYNFSVPLDTLWKEITYEPSEFFVQFGLNREMYNVELKETIGFVLGRCYTLSPRIQMTRASRDSGLSITLQHNADDIANSVSMHPPGYHAFIHYTREPFTEVTVYNGGLVDYLYCNIGETIDMKLSVDQYIMVSEDSDPCTHAEDYSANECTTQYVWDKVASMAGCSGPWMRSNYSHCDTFESMRDLIVAYMSMHENHNCSVCPRFCSAYLYNGYVTNRHFFAWDTLSYQWISKNGLTSHQTQLFVYFNSMMVSVHEQQYNYDWNVFLSDLGGSVGFLLGLSVIGLMSIFGKFWSTVIRPKIMASKHNQKMEDKPVALSGKILEKNKDFIHSPNKLDIERDYY